MYTDYPVIYESQVNQYIIFYIIGGAIILAILLFCFFSLSKVFKKANRSGISAWIPLYNIKVILEITNLPFTYFIIAMIPILNFPVNVKLARFFRKSKLFAAGLSVLPFIYLPILAFNDSEYMGINIVAMSGKKTITDIPDIDLNKNKKIEVEVNDQVDTQTSGMNISLGGGVYQKSYSNNLLGVDTDNVIFQQQKNVDNNMNNQAVQSQRKLMYSNPTKNSLFSVAFIDNSGQPLQQTVQNEVKPVNVIEKQVQEPQQQQPQVENIYNVQAKPSHLPTKPEDEFKICPTCGAKIKATSTTCFICGQKV